MTLRHALGGLQAGVAGVLSMFGWLMVAAVFTGRSAWLVPNLFATTLFGARAYEGGYLRTSAAGLALMFAIYSSLGIIWGLTRGALWGDGRRSFMVVYGAAAGLAVYVLFFDYVWKHLNPLMTLYAPDRQLQIGHVLWGAMLARSARYSRAIAAAGAPVYEGAAISGDVMR